MKFFFSKLTNLDGDCENAVEELVEYFEAKINDKAAALELVRPFFFLNRKFIPL